MSWSAVQVALVERIGKRAFLTEAGEKLSRTPGICWTRTRLPRGDAPVQRRLARTRPHRHQHDRADVPAAADPAGAQDRPSATRNQSQGRPDGDDAAIAQGQCARSRPVRLPIEDPAFETVRPVRGRTGCHPAPQHGRGAEEGNAGNFSPAARSFSATRPRRFAGPSWQWLDAPPAAAQAGDGIRQRRGDQEPGRRWSRLLDRAELVAWRRPRAGRTIAGGAAAAAREPPCRPCAASRQTQHRRRQSRRRGADDGCAAAANGR